MSSQPLEGVQQKASTTNILLEKSNISKNASHLQSLKQDKKLGTLLQQKKDDRKRQQPKIPIKDLIKREQAKRKIQQTQQVQQIKQAEQPQKAQLPVQKQPNPQSKSKTKKSHHKCQLCRQKGKKSQMIKCSVCKHYTHDECIDQINPKVQYVCYKCNLSTQQDDNKADKKLQKKLQKQQADKKMQKNKKKQQAKNMFEKFKLKYPYYITQQQKVKFPIEDKLLYIYYQHFQFPQLKIVSNDHPIIPNKYLGDLLQLQNFIVSFNEQLQEDYNGDHRKVALYYAMDCNGSDKTFQQLLSGITKIYLKDIFEKNKTENAKILNDSPFFNLLGYVIQNGHLTSDFIAMINPQIIRNLSNIPSMKISFENMQPLTKLNFESKLNLLVGLVQGLSEVDSFHDLVAKKSQKISELTKQRSEIINTIKKNEAQILSNKQKLKQQQGLPANKAKNMRLLKELNESKSKKQEQFTEETIKQMRQKIATITKQIPFVVSQTISLGKDRNQSCYYFFLRQPHRLYITYHNFLMDQNQKFTIVQKKQKIYQLMKSLNTKGVHEKRLADAIQGLIKQGIIQNLSPQLQASEQSLRRPEIINKDQLFYAQNDSTFKQNIITQILNIEQKFTNYLTMKNYRWISEQKRQQFRFGFPYIESIEAMKQQIKLMHQSFLFVEILKVTKNYQSSSNSPMQQNQPYFNELNEKQLSSKKKPIRLWGINSQKIRIYWTSYLQKCVNFVGIWYCVIILKQYVDRYVEKKNQIIKEQQRKQEARKTKQLKRKQKQSKKQMNKQSKNLRKVEQVVQPRRIKRSLRKQGKMLSFKEEDSSSQQIIQKRNTRSKAKVNKKKVQSEEEEEEQQYKLQSQSD